MIFLGHLCFDRHLSHEVRCGIFCMWHHVGAQKDLDFEAFGIPYFQIRNVKLEGKGR